MTRTTRHPIAQMYRWPMRSAVVEYLYPVDGTHFGRPWYQRHGSGRLCLVSGNTSSLVGGVPQDLTLLGGLGLSLGARNALFYRRGPRYFWCCRARLGYGPALEPALKKALCYTRPLGGREYKYSCWISASGVTLLQRDTFNIVYSLDCTVQPIKGVNSVFLCVSLP